jgi:predicted RNA-binding Zn-ribbon protein involved in translation (DUF1610 family)
MEGKCKYCGHDEHGTKECQYEVSTGYVCPCKGVPFPILLARPMTRKEKTKKSKESKSNYVIQQTEKSHCPKCGTAVHLLCKDNFDGPAFYICFHCQYVGQFGKGPVRRI